MQPISEKPLPTRADHICTLPETSKLNETSRTLVFSARIAAILMRH